MATFTKKLKSITITLIGGSTITVADTTESADASMALASLQKSGGANVEVEGTSTWIPTTSVLKVEVTESEASVEKPSDPFCVESGGGDEPTGTLTVLSNGATSSNSFVANDDFPTLESLRTHIIDLLANNKAIDFQVYNTRREEYYTNVTNKEYNGEHSFQITMDDGSGDLGCNLADRGEFSVICFDYT